MARVSSWLDGGARLSVGRLAWFSYFWLYGPTEPFFDRSWVLDDFEEAK